MRVTYVCSYAFVYVVYVCVTYVITLRIYIYMCVTCNLCMSECVICAYERYVRINVCNVCMYVCMRRVFVRMYEPCVRVLCVCVLCTHVIFCARARCACMYVCMVRCVIYVVFAS